MLTLTLTLIVHSYLHACTNVYCREYRADANDAVGCYAWRTQLLCNRGGKANDDMLHERCFRTHQQRSPSSVRTASFASSACSVHPLLSRPKLFLYDTGSIPKVLSWAIMACNPYPSYCPSKERFFKVFSPLTSCVVLRLPQHCLHCLSLAVSAGPAALATYLACSLHHVFLAAYIMDLLYSCPNAEHTDDSRTYFRSLLGAEIPGE